MPSDPRPPDAPSDMAVDRATLARYEAEFGRPKQDTANGAWLYGPARDQARAALRAAHGRTLGLDRSVCLRSIVEALERAYHPQNPVTDHPADFITREFGSGR